MKPIRDLTKRELQEVVKQLVCVLYLDEEDAGPKGWKEIWDPDKEWDLGEEMSARVVPLLDSLGLVPSTWADVGDDLLLPDDPT